MQTSRELGRVADKLGSIANALQVKLFYFFGFGLIASLALAWKVFSVESALWWNLLKCGLILMPVLICLAVWFGLSQLREAQNLIAQLLDDENRELANITDFNVKEPTGLRGVFTAIRAFREHQGLERVFDTLSGVALIANPLFVILAFLSMAMLSILILVAPFILLL